MCYFLIGWCILINLAGILVMASDKRKAQKGQWRIPEKTLFFIAFLGGSLGCIWGMYRFRHKTKHLSFRLGLPLIFFLELGAVLTLYHLGILPTP